MAIPLLKTCDLAGKDITADALLTQRALATYLVEQQAHYHFTVKGNQPTLERDIALLFEKRQKPDFVEITPPDHGRIETRSIWCSTALNAYITFPHVAQVFLIEREIIEKKTGQYSRDRTGDYQSHAARSLSATRTGHQPRALECRERSLHHRLELRRGPFPNPDRLRPGKRHSPPTLRRRHPPVLPETFAIHCRNDAFAFLPDPPRLRLLAYDEKLTHRIESFLRTNLPCPSSPDA